MTADSGSACSLSEKECKPCRGDQPPLTGEELQQYLGQIEGWQLSEEHHISKTWKFDDFAQALSFTNRVGELAEQQKHHPDIELGYGKVTVHLHTHKIKGLSEADFVLAAKIDELPQP
jgi:4a-hydroxytetrahydrobiopterin dehydratase